MDTMKKYICLLMLVATFQIAGMRSITNFLKLTQVNYDKQLQDAIANGFRSSFMSSTEAKINLAIDALEHGAKPNIEIPGLPGHPLLHYVIEADIMRDFTPVFNALIKANVDVNAPSGYGISPLAMAIDQVERSLNAQSTQRAPHEGRLYYYIDALLKAGARTTDFMAKDDNRRILYFVIDNENLYKVLTMMIASGAPVNMCDDIHGTPLQRAAYKGKGRAVIALLAAGASVLAQDKKGKNAIDAANTLGEKVDYLVGCDMSFIIELYHTCPREYTSVMIQYSIKLCLQRTVAGRAAKRAALLKILLDEDSVKKAAQGKDEILAQETTNVKKRAVKEKAPISTLPQDILCLIVVNAVTI